jgi:hypothetical protein
LPDSSDLMDPTMEFPCPSCRRVRVVDPDSPGETRCSRCGCDLAGLARLRDCAALRAGQAAAALGSGSAREAANLSARSWDLKPGTTAAACGFLAEIVKGDLPAAMRWKQRLDTARSD